MFLSNPEILKKAILVMATAIAMLFATSAFAEEKPALEEDPTLNQLVCEHKPSNIVRGILKGTASATAATAATGIGLKVTGFYTLKHAITGKIMLGSKLGGASAAGTIGIIKGTGGIIGYTASVLMSPVVIKGGMVVAVVSTVGAISYEAVCYFTEDSKEEAT